jgi:predicted DCC family thiol-disulfide oxidoreductase YuxK
MLRTKAAGRWVLLFDGHCRFCTEQSRRLLRLARPGAIEARSFHDPGALEPFPGVTHDMCMEAMHLVAPDGRVFRGAEAAARALATRRWLAPFAFAYYLPIVRQASDAVYAAIAARRYRIAGRAVERGECTDACAVHFAPRPKAKEEA